MRFVVHASAAFLVVAAIVGCSDDTTAPDDSSAGGAGGGDGGGGAGAAGGNGGGGAAACDDSGPDPNNHTAGTCSNLGETSLVAYCNEAIAELKPGVAYAAITCLANVCLRGPGCTAQEYQDQAAQCLIDALAEACPDGAADASCADLEPLCTSAAPDCHELLDGMNDETRADVLACAELDCAAGLAACVTEVLTP